MLSASGPTSGHIRRPSDDASPKRIAFLQCVGSRDQDHDYCSSVCCMYAAKEAVMTIEHARAEALVSGGDSEVFCQVFFMDMRAYSKGYEEYYHRAEQKYGVKYTRCRISDVKQDPGTGNLIVRYMTDDRRPTTDGGQQSTVISDEFDLVVLSVGMEISDSVKSLGRRLGVELDSYGFCHTTLFDPLQTRRAGIYAAGPFREPKDIPESVIEASGAAASAAQILAPARHTLTVKQEYPPERDITGEEERIGAFICHCGSNIGGYLDVPQVAEYAKSLPGVVFAEDNLYTCSQDTIAHIIEQVKEQNLNRVVVASCSPITHEALFQDAIHQAGLNPHLFEMANIRNQCSWVHSNNWDGATEKAKSLVRMAVGKAAQLSSLETHEVPVNNAALIIGGGAAGMTAALTLAEQGFPVHLVEQESELGGNLIRLRYLVDAGTGMQGKQGKLVSALSTGSTCIPDTSPQDFLADITARTTTHPLITVHLNTELKNTDGFQGNFNSKLNHNGETFDVQHGVTIIATGGVEYKGDEYGYGQDERIVTQLEFEQILSGIQSKQGIQQGIQNETSLSTLPTCLPDTVIMIQCVGPAEKFCARICCTTALKNAIKLKELNPKAEITIIYRDIRTYGFKERVYTEARRVGVRFVHYEFERKPVVRVGELASRRDSETQAPTSNLQYPKDTMSPISVNVYDSILGRDISLSPDLLVLSTPVVPPAGAGELATQLKLSRDMDGFFLEAHVKLRPVDFAADGVYMAGMAHYPKFLDESIAQAKAAASRAAITLSKETMLTNAQVAHVDPLKCVGCLTCVRICPFNVPKVSSDHTGVGNIVGAAYIEPAVCHGCGSCASECPAQAIQLMQYTDAQTLIKIDALFGVAEGFESIENIVVGD